MPAAPQPAAPQVDASVAEPRFFYGWVMLGIATVATMATSPAQTFLVGQFNTSLRESLNLTHTSLAGAYMAGTLAAAVPMIFVGRLSDRFGPRVAMACAAAGLGLTCMLMGQATGMASVVVGFFFLRFFGQGALALTAGHTVALWFRDKLGRVEGIRVACFAAGIAILPLLTVSMIETFGWRMAYATLGLGVWIAVIPATIVLFRNRPEDLGQRVDGAVAAEEHPEGSEGEAPEDEPAFTLLEAMRTRAYWALMGPTVANALMATALIFHLQPLAEEAGIDPARTASVLTTFALVAGVFNLVAGYLADHLAIRWMLAIGVGMLAGCILLLRLGGPLPTMHLAMAVLGLGQAFIFLAAGPSFARFFGRAHHGAIRGSVTFFAVAGTSAGPVIMGAAFDRLGSFDQVLLAFALACVPLVLVALTAKAPARQHGMESESEDADSGNPRL